MRDQIIEDTAHPRVAAGTTRLCWHIITSEYPPQIGGVSDYTRGVATALAAEGDEVHVWCPPYAGQERHADGVTVHPELGAITARDLRHVSQQLEQFPAPKRILVQWVPHGYGCRSMNVGFCWWLRKRATRHKDIVELMVHEPYLPFQARSLRQNVAAAVHRFMTILLLSAAHRVWLSIPAWESCLRPYTLGRALPFQWLPIPSTIPVAANPGRVAALRRRLAPEDTVLIGHLGTYGWPITALVEPVLSALAEDRQAQAVLLMGRGSDIFRETLIRARPSWAAWIHATGELAPEELSCHVAACDLLLQPYPDGVSSRRTSFMVGLSHGKPVVTTSGPLTESLWAASDAVPMAVGGTPQIVELTRQVRDDRQERMRLSAAASKLYEQQFELARVVSTLRSAAADLSTR